MVKRLKNMRQTDIMDYLHVTFKSCILSQVFNFYCFHYLE